MLKLRTMRRRWQVLPFTLFNEPVVPDAIILLILNDFHDAIKGCEIAASFASRCFSRGWSMPCGSYHSRCAPKDVADKIVTTRLTGLTA
jgi:hypothetical protein